MKIMGTHTTTDAKTGVDTVEVKEIDVGELIPAQIKRMASIDDVQNAKLGQ